MKVIGEELRSIEKNMTWRLTPLPIGKKAIYVRWLYKVKLNPKGEVSKYKVRLVANRFL